MLRAIVRVVLAGVLAAAVLGFSTAAFADDLQNCIDQGTVNGVPPTCVEENGKYVPETTSGGFGTDGGSGIPAGFVLFGVLAVVIGIGTTAWKVSTARRLAQDSGMDPSVATTMTLLTPNGLDATYLAATLKAKGHDIASEPSPEPTSAGKAEDRLATLKRLLDDGVVTQPEYNERRQAIINDI